MFLKKYQETFKWQGNQLLLLTLVSLVVAYCSIVYELLLAQCLSMVLGQSFLRYTLTIGFYLFSLGVGALLVDYLPEARRLSGLIYIELLLCLLGAAIPWVIFSGDAALGWVFKLCQLDPLSGLAQTVTMIYMHSWIFVIGILSGCEIPLLMEIAAARASEKAASYVLGFDYIGTFIGAISFPLFTYHYLGIVAGAAFTAILNAVAAWGLMSLLGGQRRQGLQWLCYGIFGAGLLAISFEEALRQLVVQIFMQASSAGLGQVP